MEKLKQFILDNYVRYNRADKYIDISGLDFSDFDGNIHATEWTVKGNLYASFLDVGGDLRQHTAKVGGDLVQDDHIVRGNLHQGNHLVYGDYYGGGYQVGGTINVNKNRKMLKEITKEELAEMGYEIVGVK